MAMFGTRRSQKRITRKRSIDGVAALWRGRLAVEVSRKAAKAPREQDSELRALASLRDPLLL